jgi:hypothetical protein
MLQKEVRTKKTLYIHFFNLIYKLKFAMNQSSNTISGNFQILVLYHF